MTTLRCVRLPILLTAPVLLVANAAAIGPGDFAAQLPLSVSGNNGVVQFRLPLAVYQHAQREELADLRVFDAQGRSLPFALSQLDATADQPLELRLRPAAGAVEGDWVYASSPAIAATALMLQLAQPNTVLPVSIGVYRLAGVGPPARAPQFQPRIQGQFHRLTRDGLEQSSGWLSIAPTAAAQWVIQPDRAGEEAPDLLLRWIPQTLVFTARGTVFTLAVGAGQEVFAGVPGLTTLEQVAPGYAMSELARLEQARAGPLQIAPRSVVPVERPATAPIDAQAVEQRKLLLWGVLLAGMLVLAWMSWRLFKQMQATAGQPPDRTD